MITLRPSESRGHFDNDWAVTRHTFSSGEYYNPQHMGFRSLRVLNEGILQPGHGYPSRTHTDLDIVNYVVSGALVQKTDQGENATLAAGDVQRIRAGTGFSHALENEDAERKAHFLQIWMEVDRAGEEPAREQKNFSRDDKTNKLTLIAGPNGPQRGALRLHSDASIYACVLKSGKGLSHMPYHGRSAWVQVIWGDVALNEEYWMRPGDGAAITGEMRLHFTTRSGAEFLLFDLA